MEKNDLLTYLIWETRNLEIPAFAISEKLGSEPDATNLRSQLNDLRRAHKKYFVCARVLSNTKSSRILEAAGFYFVETVVSPHSILSKNELMRTFISDPGAFLPTRYSVDDMRVDILSRDQLVLIDEVREIARNSFSDDRFHRDHNCDKRIANQRYVHWVNDLLEDGAISFRVLKYQGVVIAFMASKGGNLLFAGFSKKYTGAGLGEYFWLSVMRQLECQGIGRIETLISVNNIAVLNLYSKLRFKFRFPRSGFHYWSSK